MPIVRTMREVVEAAVLDLPPDKEFHPLDLRLTNGKGRPIGANTIAYHLAELTCCAKVADGQWRRVKVETRH